MVRTHAQTLDGPSSPPKSGLLNVPPLKKGLFSGPFDHFTLSGITERMTEVSARKWPIIGLWMSFTLDLLITGLPKDNTEHIKKVLLNLTAASVAR